MYSPGKVTMQMPAFTTKLLAQANMSECNPVQTTLPMGTLLSKQDCPDSSIAKDQTIAASNKLIQKEFSTYDEIRQFYSSIMSSVGWLTKQVAPVLAHGHSILSRGLAGPSIKAMKALKHMLRYISGKIDSLKLTYRKTRDWDWRGHADVKLSRHPASG